MKITAWRKENAANGDFRISTIWTDNKKTEHVTTSEWWHDTDGTSGVDITCTCGFKDNRLDSKSRLWGGNPHDFKHKEDPHVKIGNNPFKPDRFTDFKLLFYKIWQVEKGHGTISKRILPKR